MLKSFPSLRAPGYGIFDKAMSGFVPATGSLVKNSYITHLTSAEKTRQDGYKSYREYYNGDHDTMLTVRIRKFLEIKDSQEFNYNLCPIVIDALSERLKVTGFDAGDQGETFWQWWDDNNMDGKQGIVHTAAVRDGDTYVLVEWDQDNDRPRYAFELACAENEGVKVHYSQEHSGEIEFASKRWIVSVGEGAGKKRRLNLYYPDHIEKYISVDGQSEGNYQAHLDEQTNGNAPGVIQEGALGQCGWYWWTDTGQQGGKPIGVPVVHFKNKDQGYDWGTSELSDVVPLQNALNKATIDLIASSDVSAFRILVAMGDKWDNISVYPGALIQSEKPRTEADVKTIEGEDPTRLIASVDRFVMASAQVSRTPISYFQVSKERPAEGTLQQEESGLVAKSEKCQTDFGNSWEQMMVISRRLANVFGGMGMDEKQSINCEWKEAQTRNELQHLQTLLLKKQLGVPDDQIWREMGYDEDKIAKFKKTKLLNQARAIRQFQGAGPTETASQQQTGAPNGQSAAERLAANAQPEQPAQAT